MDLEEFWRIDSDFKHWTLCRALICYRKWRMNRECPICRLLTILRFVDFVPLCHVDMISVTAFSKTVKMWESWKISRESCRIWTFCVFERAECLLYRFIFTNGAVFSVIGTFKVEPVHASDRDICTNFGRCILYEISIGMDLRGSIKRWWRRNGKSRWKMSYLIRGIPKWPEQSRHQNGSECNGQWVDWLLRFACNQESEWGHGAKCCKFTKYLQISGYLARHHQRLDERQFWS